MTIFGDGFYRAGCILALLVFIVGLAGATCTGVWWTFHNAGAFFAFLALAGSGVVWAFAIDTMYRFWGSDDLIIDVEPEDGSDP